MWMLPESWSSSFRVGNPYLAQIKSAAYSSQGSYAGELDSAIDWQMAVRRNNVISITLRQV